MRHVIYYYNMHTHIIRTYYVCMEKTFVDRRRCKYVSGKSTEEDRYIPVEKRWALAVTWNNNNNKNKKIYKKTVSTV